MKRYAFLCAGLIALTAAICTVTPREYDTGPPVAKVEYDKAVSLPVVSEAIFFENLPDNPVVPEPAVSQVNPINNTASVGGGLEPPNLVAKLEAFIFNIAGVKKLKAKDWKPFIKPLLLVPWQTDHTNASRHVFV